MKERYDYVDKSKFDRSTKKSKDLNRRAFLAESRPKKEVKDTFYRKPYSKD